jgi:RimJ/RimL family protein N-acetyltransferase
VFVRWIFDRLMPRRIVASTEYENQASRRVMQNLGMTVHVNPFHEPPWFQVLGVLNNPAARRPDAP